MKQIINKIKAIIEQKMHIVLPLLVGITILLECNKIFGGYDNFLIEIQRYLFSVNLNFLNSRIFTFAFSSYGGDYLSINGLNIIFILILLIAYLLYHFTKGKEKRLLQFSFSILFILSVVKIIMVLFLPLKYLDIQFVWLFYLIAQLFWVVVFYSILKILSKDQQIKTEERSSLNDYRNFKLKSASRWQRLFHLIFDTLFIVLIASKLVRFLPGNALKAFVDIIGEQFTVALFIFICTSLYYILFELLFKATPAKYLTQTQVVSLTESPLTTGNIIVRSFSRRIPFNPLSFLGDQLGWHDSISKTTVVQLERTGKHGSWYWLIFPFFLIVFLLIHLTNQYVEDYARCKRAENEFYNKNEETKRKLKNLSGSDFIVLQETGKNFSNSYYLKVSLVSKDSVDCYIINENYKASTLKEADQFYGGYYAELETVTISKKALKSAICENYEAEFKGCGVKLLKSNTLLRIKQIETLIEPSLQFSYMSFNSSRNGNYSFYIELINSGNTITIEKIEAVNNDVIFKSTVPISGYKRYDGEIFRIKGSGLKPKEKGMFKFFILDNITSERFIYQLEIEGKYKKRFRLVESL